MGNAFESDDCLRQRLTVKEENYYFLVGKTFIIPVHPRENDQFVSEGRELMERVCCCLTEALERLHGIKPEDKEDECQWFYVRQNE